MSYRNLIKLICSTLSIILDNIAQDLSNILDKYHDNVYYLKGQNIDADFYIEESGEVIQVAYSGSNISSDREIRALAEAAKTVKEAKRFIIITYEEEKELTVDGVQIEVIPV